MLKNIFKISILKTIWFNLHCFGIKGFKMPVIVARKCKLRVKGKIVLNRIKTATVTIGFGGSDGVAENRYSFFSVERGAKIEFLGSAGISAGNTVRVDQGTLSIGNRFSTNKNCFIACSKGIVIGEDVTFGWNVNVRDNDGHKIIDNTSGVVSESQPVHIGNHVWVCSYSDILKGCCDPPN